MKYILKHMSRLWMMKDAAGQAYLNVSIPIPTGASGRKLIDRIMTIRKERGHEECYSEDREITEVLDLPWNKRDVMECPACKHLGLTCVSCIQMKNIRLT